MKICGFSSIFLLGLAALSNSLGMNLIVFYVTLKKYFSICLSIQVIFVFFWVFVRCKYLKITNKSLGKQSKIIIVITGFYIFYRIIFYITYPYIYLTYYDILMVRCAPYVVAILHLIFYMIAIGFVFSVIWIIHYIYSGKYSRLSK